MTDRVGEELGKYRLIRLLGRGSFAEVYLGEHIYLKAEASVKVLRTQLADNDVDSFLKEAQTVARLVHPHIIRIFDFDVHEGTPFLVMDYAPHGTLRQRHLRGIPVPLRTVVDYVKQVADALQYAHNLKFIHRDVKPENMLLGRRDEVLLSDFGIVQVVINTLSENEGTQKIEGTIAYMAPEQLRGKARYATDQYALGVIVYEWLSGNRPFQGSLSELASQHMFVPPPPLREKVPTISPAIEEVVMMALAKDPRQRFATVQAFANALEQAASVTPPLSYAGTSPYAPTAPIVFTPPPMPASVNEPPQVQPQLPPQPLPTVLASPGIRPMPGQQPPVIPTSSASSGAGMPVFTDPPAQIPVQPPTIALAGPAGSHPTGIPRSPLPQLFKNKVGRNVLLIALAILIIASTLTAVFLLRKSPSAPPGNGIGVSKAPDGEYIGISDGTFAFDTNRPDGALKQQAAARLKAHDRTGAIKLLQQAVREDTNDAEALIYLEDLRVLASSRHYITLVAGTFLTGDSVGDGHSNLQGAYVAQKEYNDGMKLPGGVQVRLLIANSGSEEVYATPIAKQIVQAAWRDQTIVGVMGWPLNKSTKVAIGVLGPAHIPMVSPTAFFDFLTDISPYFFRVIPSNKRQVAVGVQYAEHTLHATRAAFFVDPANDYSSELAVDFQLQFTADGNKIAAIENYTIGHPDSISRSLQDALQHDPDLIYFAGYASDADALLADLPTSGPFAKLQVIGGNALFGRYSGKAQAAFKRLHFTTFVDPNAWDDLGLSTRKPAFFADYVQYFDPHQQHTGTPDGYTSADTEVMFSYDAMLALLGGSQIALGGFSRGKKSFSPVDLQQTLTKISGSQAIQGVTGQIAFASDGNVINKAVAIGRLNPNGTSGTLSVQGSFLVGS
jgi:eukaryotic-like serine/threonine-protein kinase